VDVVPSRLEFAKNYAATDVFQPPPLKVNETRIEYSKRSAAAMKKSLEINSIDLVVDASGAEVSVQTALYIVKPGGTLVHVSLVHDLLRQAIHSATGRYGKP
jgi:D-xylulose reductase